MGTKEKIITATIELIKKSGEETTNISTRTIAKKIGANVAAVNYYFDSKDHLIRVCIERILDEIIGTFEPSAHNSSDFKKRKLKVLFDLFVAYPTVAKISILAEILGYDLYNKEQRDAILDLLADSLFDKTEKQDPKTEIKQEKKNNENSQR
jgi:AcrR family transcriptional regulator